MPQSSPRTLFSTRRSSQIPSRKRAAITGSCSITTTASTHPAATRAASLPKLAVRSYTIIPIVPKSIHRGGVRISPRLTRCPKVFCSWPPFPPPLGRLHGLPSSSSSFNIDQLWQGGNTTENETQKYLHNSPYQQISLHNAPIDQCELRTWI